MMGCHTLKGTSESEDPILKFCPRFLFNGFYRFPDPLNPKKCGVNYFWSKFLNFGPKNNGKSTINCPRKLPYTYPIDLKFW